jgi:hypothetical protein
MNCKTTFLTAMALGIFAATAASADCKGSNGRGWGKGQGKGQFEMSAADKKCFISYPGFIYEAENRRVPANEVKLTRAPKNGTISLSKDGLIYTPAAGFKGQDKFCTKNTAKGEKGSLSGCVTVTVK